MDNPSWPALPLDRWRDTYATLHMWSQIVGKTALALSTPLNHFWNIAFLLTARGFSTHTLNAGSRGLTIQFDFVDHVLDFRCSDGGSTQITLEPMTVADFHRLFMNRLAAIGVTPHLWTMPVEIPDPIRFELDTVHRSYDRDAVADFWRALALMRPVFEAFRARYIGKSSPVHFFWGSFDLATTRFSGKRAPERPDADRITREAYSHEVISHGFWPGSGPVQEAAFYAYAAPEPPGFRAATVRPAAASYHADPGEFILPYEAIRRSSSPAAELTAFLDSTYAAGAELAGWSRRELERT
jgi:hypothetical protein